MKFTLSWLEDHLAHQASLEEVADRLTMIGLEVEAIDNPKKRFEGFVTAFVEECAPHPEADRLKVCTVSTGSAQFQVVCGAPNARKGLKGVFAPAGTHIPGTDLDLKITKIRNVESQGMLCSERELTLSDEHDGIIDLEGDVKIGQDFASFYGLDDPIIEIKLTPNRSDCFGVRGIARDLVAAGLGQLKPLPDFPKQGVFDSPVKWALAAKQDCPYASGIFLKNLENKASPSWMQRRMKAIGISPISALVDITNYITIDLGRPLHAFDADKISGQVLTVQKAKKGETLAALNGKSYDLDPAMTVISDATGVVSLGGIMGGMATGCSFETRNVFLESALFSAQDIAKTGRRLRIDSDARQRFERGVDPLFVKEGLHHAVRLISEICGGEYSKITFDGTPEVPERTVSLSMARLTKMIGCTIPCDEARVILEKLGFCVTVEKGTLHAIVPSWRPDISTDACLCEEIMRIYGYDKVPACSLRGELPKNLMPTSRRSGNRARRILVARGYYETISWSFTSEKLAKAFGGGSEKLKLLNPISSELSDMRPSGLANLMQAAKENRDAGIQHLALFESGPSFDADKGEFWSIAALRYGLSRPRHWAENSDPVDAYDAKADLYAVLDAFGVPRANLRFDRNAPAWFHPGRSAGLVLGKQVLGYFGELHPKTCELLDIKGRLIAFECFCDRIPAITYQIRRKAIEKHSLQSIYRDFAFLFDKDVLAEKIMRAISSVERKIISDVSIFDLYDCEKTRPGKKSMALSVTLQPVGKTLTDADIEAISQKIITVAQKEGGILRGA